MMIRIVPHVKEPGQGTQDMLADSLVYGMVRAYGSENVELYPYKIRDMYNGHSDYMGHWPVFLGIHALRGAGFPPSDSRKHDWLVISHDALERYDGVVNPEKTIVFNGSDNPGEWHPRSEGCFRIARPGGPPADMLVHISVPFEHIYYQMSQVFEHSVAPIATGGTYVALNDNHHSRRTLLDKLAASNIPDLKLRWGSASGYVIPRTEGAISPPVYYHEMKNCLRAVSCRGGNVDCLRTWEILAMGRLLITDDFGFKDQFVDSIHCLYYTSPEEAIEKIWWSIDNPTESREIAREGHHVFMKRHTPTAQAWQILAEATK